MKSLPYERSPLAFAACLAAAGLGLVEPAWAGEAAAKADAAKPVYTFEQIAWREVQDGAGRRSGAVSDVLAELPSGKIAFVAINPTRLFGRDRAVPPEKLKIPEGKDGPLELTMSDTEWINAPRLDWAGATLSQPEQEGERLIGQYQQEWRRQEEVDPTAGMVVVALPSNAPSPVRYVSLRDQLQQRVAAPGWPQEGFLNDFVIDWTAKRVTHALVSPQFPPLARPNETWFAIPVTALSPPVQQDAITVRSDASALGRAPEIASANEIPAGDTPGFYRLPPSFLAGAQNTASR